jgi:hypothetical protein
MYMEMNNVSITRKDTDFPHDFLDKAEGVGTIESS